MDVVKTIPELHTYTSSDFADLASLMQELSSNIVFTREFLERMLADSNSHLYVIREEGRIVACVGSEGISDLWN